MDNKEFLIFALVMIFATIAMVAGGYLGNVLACKAKTNAIGYKYEYGFFKGCVVEKHDGQKVLLEQLRDIGY